MGSSVKLVSSVFKLCLVTLIVDKISGAENKQYWQDLGHADVMDSLTQKWNTNIAKNVIIFLGDGMSPETITASRIYNRGEESYLAWERFPHVGLLKTYDSDKQVPDSASTATAVFCGVKTNYAVAGVDANVKKYDCEASLKKENHVDSILAWGQNAGKDTGFVTTTRVTHATPSALYAHSAYREWECEDTMPKSASNCKDIARQLIEDKPGRDIKVIMGGGRQMLQSHVSARDQDLPLINNVTCYSRDGRDLVKDWQADKERRNFTHTVVQNTGELLAVDPEKTDFLMGIFANAYMSMDWNRKTGPEGQPSLEEMTTTAIKVLQKSKKGFVLVVEGGLIDVAHHNGQAAPALRETVRMSEAIEATLKLVDTSETLVIVTSDHGHALLFRGISDRGANILGTIKNTESDKIPYTTLGYATGGPQNMAYENVNGTVMRKNPEFENTTAFTYNQQAAVILDDGKHSGVDVAVYAIGPHAHLFHSTHEQVHVAHVAAYAAKIGRYQGCMNYEKSHGSSLTARSLALSIALLVPFFR